MYSEGSSLTTCNKITPEGLICDQYLSNMNNAKFIEFLVYFSFNFIAYESVNTGTSDKVLCK